ECPLTEISPLGPLFRRWSRRLALSTDDRSAVASLGWIRRQYQRDYYLAREGEPTTICTLLIEGLAYRQKILSDGSRQIISFHIAGEFLDLQNCLLEVADHNVQALTRCKVAAVPKELVLEVMNFWPAVRRAIWLDSLID